MPLTDILKPFAEFERAYPYGLCFYENGKSFIEGAAAYEFFSGEVRLIAIKNGGLRGS